MYSPGPRYQGVVSAKAREGRAPQASGETASTAFIDRTAKLYIGGRQARPDGGYSRPVLSPSGALIGEVGEGNRKDIRNAVEAARAALGWGTTSAHNRAQILYFLAENLDYRRDEFAARIRAQTGATAAAAAAEVTGAIDRLFTFAGWADKYDGAVHNPPARAVAADVDERRRRLPGRRGVVVVGDAERGARLLQQLEGLGHVPARMAELEGAAAIRRQEAQEGRQPLGLEVQVRRQLEEHRPEVLAERGHAPEHQLDGIGAVVQLLVVGDEAGRLP